MSSRIVKAITRRTTPLLDHKALRLDITQRLPKQQHNCLHSLASDLGTRSRFAAEMEMGKVRQFTNTLTTATSDDAGDSTRQQDLQNLHYRLSAALLAAPLRQELCEELVSNAFRFDVGTQVERPIRAAMLAEYGRARGGAIGPDTTEMNAVKQHLLELLTPENRLVYEELIKHSTSRISPLVAEM